MSTKLDCEERSSSSKEEHKEDDTISMTCEMCRMSFETVRPSLDRLTSMERKVIGYKTRTVSEPIYEDELVKNMTWKYPLKLPIQTPIASISQ